MKNEINKLFLEGLSYSKIAKELNCSKSTVSYHCDRIKNGKFVEKSEYLHKYSEKSLLKFNILKLRSEGKSYDEISELLNCSKSTISYHCSNNDLSDIGLNELRKKNIIKTESRKCKSCDIEFIVKINSKKKYCNQSCYNNSDIKKENSRKGGLKSSHVQNELRRSKNEIHFFELCKEKYVNVLNNEAIFNGWDADIIIFEYKIAVLWNGKWHYEKITEKHSVKQVENRDRIKIKEIKSCGYTPYIIKDMGRDNKDFVEKEFEKFTGYISSLS